MPRRKSDFIPPLKRKSEKARPDRAYVWLAGRSHYLGLWGSKASEEAYERLIGVWLANGRKLPAVQVKQQVTVGELILAYVTFCKTYYIKNGEQTDEVHGVIAAVKILNRMFGRIPIDDFTAVQLAKVQSAMVETGNSRNYINKNVGRIKRMFKWGTKNGLVSNLSFFGLQAVDGLKRNRTAAPDNEPVKPVDQKVIDATLQHCTPNVKSMVQFQLLTGCRPGEVCSMCVDEIDTSDPSCWVYQPSSHKMDFRGRSRKIFIGHKAQQLIKLQMGPTYTKQLVFLSKFGKRFRVTNYRQRIHTACKKAKVDNWNPNQLRHNAATLLREQFGIEVAQTVLGHAAINTTEIYAERDEAKAKAAIRQIAG